MGIRVVEAAVSDNGRIAYFCPSCGEPIIADSKDESLTTAIAKNHDWRCMIDECLKDKNALPHLVVWRV